MLDRMPPLLLLRMPPRLRRLLAQGLLAGTLLAGSQLTVSAQVAAVSLGKPRALPAAEGVIQQAVFLVQPRPEAESAPAPSLSTESILRIEQSLWTRGAPAQERVRAEIDTILRSGTPAQQAGVIAMLADTAEQLRKQKLTSPGYPALWMTTFTEQLMRLALSSDDASVRAQAGRALAMVGFDPAPEKPRPRDIARVLQTLTQPGNPVAVRHAGAEALTILGRTLNYLHTFPSPFQVRYDATLPGEGRRPGDPEDPERMQRTQENARRQGWWDALLQGRMAVMTAAQELLFDQDARLQREALRAIEVVIEDLLVRTSAYTSDDSTGTASVPIVEDPLLHRTLLTTDDLLRLRINRERFAQLVEKLRPMLEVLQEVIPALGRRAQTSQNQDIITSSLRGLESLARLRWQLYVAPSSPEAPERPEQAPPPRIGVQLNVPRREPVVYGREVPVALTPVQLAQEPELKLPDDRYLKKGIEAAFPSLRQLLGHQDPVVRRGTVDVIESMGDLADELIPDLTRVLTDRDKFVRWASARTLGRLAPRQAARVVPGLARLLGDVDTGVRSAAATALKNYGEEAREAVPGLAASIQRSDADYRLDAIAALRAIGAAAAPAVPALVHNLHNSDPRVRRAAATALGDLGPLASQAAPELRQLLNDENEEVRRAASEALLEVTAPPPSPRRRDA